MIEVTIISGLIIVLILFFLLNMGVILFFLFKKRKAEKEFEKRQERIRRMI